MLTVQSVTKRFENGVCALSDVSLAAVEGEVLSLIGPSGCGKSTLLRIIAGLDRRFQGRVVIDGNEVSGPHPSVGVVFQEPRLMPWLTVIENVAFGLKGPQEEREEQALEYVRLVGLDGFEGALPRQLSGGMAQRVALARALVTEPAALLMDEPFSSLDALTRMQLQDHLIRIWEQRRLTMILVTHDVDESVYVADRVAVMAARPGRIQAELTVELPRPRDRGSAELVEWRTSLLHQLNLSQAGPRAEPKGAETISKTTANGVSA